MGLIEKGKAIANKISPNRELLWQYWHQFQEQLQILWAKLHDLSGTNWQLALYHFDRFNLDDAIFRCRFVLFLTPDKYQALYLLGRCYFEKNKLTKARLYLEKYLLSTDQEWRLEAQYCLYVVKGEYVKITNIPPRIIQSNFDRIAQIFDPEIIHQNQQAQNESLFNLLNQQVQHSSKPLGNSILDLGCGIGSFGELCRTARIASNIVGVDFSPEMIEHSRSLQIDGIQAYSQLHCADVADFLAADSQVKYDAIIAADLLMYYPQPTVLFAAAQRLGAAQSWLGMSFKVNNNSDNISFGEAIEQFFINADYVLNSAKAHGWHLISRENITYSDSRQGVALLFSNQETATVYNTKMEEQS